MSMYSDFEVRRVPLFIERCRREWEELLHKANLSPSAPICVAGLYDSDNRLRGCASLCQCGTRLSVQCVAMDPQLEEHGQVGRLIDFLKIAADETSAGSQNLMLFTKPEYEGQFRSLAFHTIATAPKAVMLESNRSPLKKYCASLASLAEGKGKTGVIVMNANPFTQGHLYLVTNALRKVDHLFIIPVLDDSPGGFPYQLRKQMIQQGVKDYSNVTVVEGSPYAVSAATFPTYFIKEVTDRTDTHITLDLNIFTRHIAPALKASVRFVGSEPTDALTARYNKLMHQLLPRQGVEVIEIERLTADYGDIVSASRVRQLLGDHRLTEASGLLPASTVASLLGDLAGKALLKELFLDPKPGLVTPLSRGAHADMDFNLMQRSVKALIPEFSALTRNILLSGKPSIEALTTAGVGMEKIMLDTTGGINTHRGAIFSVGLMIAAAALLIHENVLITDTSLSDTIRQLATALPAPDKSHGADVRKNIVLRSAPEMAKEGYKELFADWLPFWRSLPVSDEQQQLQKLLLKIIMRLDDTNLCHRGGVEALDYAKKEAATTLHNFSEVAYEAFCRDMTARNLSPGGGADMLALTLLADSLTTNN